MNGSGGAIFTLTDIDLSPLTSTISATAPVLITAGIAVALTMLAVYIVPKMFKKMIKA